MTLQKTVDQATILHGDRAKLKDLLRLRLTECGWTDQVQHLCREAIKDNAAHWTVESIVQNITPKARALVPDTVKKELVQKIKTILTQKY